MQDTKKRAVKRAVKNPKRAKKTNRTKTTCKCCKTSKNDKQLDTLVIKSDKHTLGEEITLNKSTDGKDQSTLFKRAKRKYLQQPLALSLESISQYALKLLDDIALYDESEINQLTADQLRLLIPDREALEAHRKAFRNMAFCASTLVRKGKKITSRYCRNRTCIVCNSIRQAVLLKRYKPVMQDWNCYFVTLTIPNVIPEKLRTALDEMNLIFKRIKDKASKHIRRVAAGKSERRDNMPNDHFKGLRKYECTINANTKTLHPHFHFIVDSKETADYILREWLARTQHLGTNGTDRKGQEVSKATPGTEMELFKYFTKVVSSEKTKEGNKKIIYIKYVYDIYKGFQGVQTFRHFGFKMPKVDEAAEVQAEEVVEVQEQKPTESEYYNWQQSEGDYIGQEYGERLTGHRPAEGLNRIVKSITPPKYSKWQSLIDSIYSHEKRE